MKIIFLGTNGWYTTPTGNTACVLIDSKDHYVIFDAGNGIYQLDEYIKEDKPISLFISHFHIDHTSGLHTLNKFNFPVNVYVGPGRGKDFETLVNPPFTSPKNVKLTELKEGKNNLSSKGGPASGWDFEVEVVEQFHTYRDHGFRITLEDLPATPERSDGGRGKIIAYSGDCGISKNSIPLAKDANLLIHECSYKANHQEDTWGHVGPIEAAQLAKDAGVKQLILTHFDASQYTDLKDRKESEKQAQEIFPNTTAATDDLIVEL